MSPANPSAGILPNVPFRLTIEQIKQTADVPGLIRIHINGELVLSTVATEDLAINPMTELKIGAMNVSIPDPFVLYMADLTMGTFPVYDYRSRYTGDYDPSSGDKLLIRNGLIVGVEP